MDNFTGLTIDHRYHILERKDEGGMAVIFKAYDLRLECDVAIKLIRKEAFPADSFEGVLKRFHREARTLAQLNNHPNIIQIIDFNEFEGLPYMVMPFINGGTLKDILDKRIFSSGEAARFILPIAKALVYAHSRDKIHRDIKPSNILVTDDGNVLLTDFGIAQIIEEANSLSRLTKTGMAIGTPEYMAPEQWMGKPDKASDQYGLGVVFYQMITGRVPYEAETVPAVMLKQATEPLPRPSSFVSTVPYEVEKIIFRALAKDPKDRYPSMAEFTMDLEKLIGFYPGSTEIADTIIAHEDEEPAQVLPTVRKKTSEVILPINEVPKLVEETVNKEYLPNIPDKIIKTGSGKIRLTRWVWIIGIFLLLGFFGIGIWRMKLFPAIGLSNQPTQTALPPSGIFTPISTQKITQTQIHTKTITKTQVPTKTITPSPQFSLYDSFNSSKIDPLLWSYDTSFSNQIQIKNGSVTISAKGGGNSLTASRYSSWKLDQIGRVEALLQINSTDNAYGFSNIMISTELDDGKGTWWAQCRLGGSNNLSAQLICDSFRWKDESDMTYVTSAFPVEYGKYYNVAIQIAEDGSKVEYYLDGNLIGTYIPPEYEQLVNARFDWNIGVWTSGAGIVNGSFYEVYVGVPLMENSDSSAIGNFIYLSDITPFESTGYGSKSIGVFPFTEPGIVKKGDQLITHGIYYPHGIFAHAPSKMAYKIPEGYTKFYSDIVIHPACGQPDGAVFYIKADENIIYTSTEMEGTDSIIEVNVDISGVKILELYTDEISNQDCDWTIWGDPRILK